MCAETSALRSDEMEKPAGKKVTSLGARAGLAHFGALR
jgi:hypothetical protein